MIKSMVNPIEIAITNSFFSTEGNLFANEMEFEMNIIDSTTNPRFCGPDSNENCNANANMNNMNNETGKKHIYNTANNTYVILNDNKKVNYNKKTDYTSNYSTQDHISQRIKNNRSGCCRHCNECRVNSYYDEQKKSDNMRCEIETDDGGRTNLCQYETLATVIIMRHGARTPKKKFYVPTQCSSSAILSDVSTCTISKNILPTVHNSSSVFVDSNISPILEPTCMTIQNHALDTSNAAHSSSYISSHSSAEQNFISYFPSSVRQWPSDLKPGQLTPYGFLQAKHVGAALRQEYGRKIASISKVLNQRNQGGNLRNLIYVRCTESTRCIETAEAVLKGFLDRKICLKRAFFLAQQRKYNNKTYGPQYFGAENICMEAEEIFECDQIECQCDEGTDVDIIDRQLNDISIQLNSCSLTKINDDRCNQLTLEAESGGTKIIDNIVSTCGVSMHDYSVNHSSVDSSSLICSAEHGENFEGNDAIYKSSELRCNKISTAFHETKGSIEICGNNNVTYTDMSENSPGTPTSYGNNINNDNYFTERTNGNIGQLVDRHFEDDTAVETTREIGEANVNNVNFCTAKHLKSYSGCTMKAWGNVMPDTKTVAKFDYLETNDDINLSRYDIYIGKRDRICHESRSSMLGRRGTAATVVVEIAGENTAESRVLKVKSEEIRKRKAARLETSAECRAYLRKYANQIELIRSVTGWTNKSGLKVMKKFASAFSAYVAHNQSLPFHPPLQSNIIRSACECADLVMRVQYADTEVGWLAGGYALLDITRRFAKIATAHCTTLENTEALDSFNFSSSFLANSGLFDQDLGRLNSDNDYSNKYSYQCGSIDNSSRYYYHAICKHCKSIESSDRSSYIRRSTELQNPIVDRESFNRHPNPPHNKIFSRFLPFNDSTASSCSCLTLTFVSSSFQSSSPPSYTTPIHSSIFPPCISSYQLSYSSTNTTTRSSSCPPYRPSSFLSSHNNINSHYRSPSSLHQSTRVSQHFVRDDKKSPFVLFITHQSALLALQSALCIQQRDIHIPQFACYIAADLIYVPPRKCNSSSINVTSTVHESICANSKVPSVPKTPCFFDLSTSLSGSSSIAENSGGLLELPVQSNVENISNDSALDMYSSQFHGQSVASQQNCMKSHNFSSTCSICYDEYKKNVTRYTVTSRNVNMDREATNIENDILLQNRNLYENKKYHNNSSCNYSSNNSEGKNVNRSNNLNFKISNNDLGNAVEIGNNFNNSCKYNKCDLNRKDESTSMNQNIDLLAPGYYVRWTIDGQKPLLLPSFLVNSSKNNQQSNFKSCDNCSQYHCQLYEHFQKNIDSESYSQNCHCSNCIPNMAANINAGCCHNIVKLSSLIEFAQQQVNLYGSGMKEETFLEDKNFKYCTL